MKKVKELHGIKINPVDLERAVKIVARSIPEKNGDYFCFANIHVVMECNKHIDYKDIINKSSGNFPDGMGVAWVLKFLGNKFNDRVRGADFMLGLCEYAAKNKLTVFFYGNTEETLEALKMKLKAMFPGLEIVGAISPPFRPLTKEEDEAYVKQINDSGANILFVSLGAPKQEQWMAEHKGKIKAVQLGVGAAFSFITGKVKEAPKWMQKSGLEWLFRLPQQPGKTISRMSLVPEFLIRTLIQCLKPKKPKPPRCK
jgi:N-acetylglucosaminyldiphosphoundecaprenol N-acetyl-beta-D-mannosaminyltransferase